MQENLEKSLVYILNDEGGFAIRSNEPGGACNRGISLAKLEEWNAKKSLPVPTIDDLKALTEEQAREIYTEDFWKAIMGSALPAKVDYCLMDCAVNEGVSGAIKQLQDALCLKQNGKWDWTNAQWEMIFTADPMLIVERICWLRLEKKKQRPEWNEHVDPRSGETIHGFGPGWTNRVNRILDRCREL